MAGVAPRLGPAELASRLGALRVRVDAVHVEVELVPLADYPGGRPSSVVRLSGGEHTGQGENVAFELGDHERFVATVSEWFREQAAERELEVGSALRALPSPYERAALEAALIDLALRQAGLTLGELTGVDRASLRFVASLGASPEPVAAIERLRAAGFHGDLKLDADPGWPRDVRDSLRGATGIAIIDFKRRGDAEFARELAALFPDARLEDPPVGLPPDLAPPARIVRDAMLLGEAEVRPVLARGECVNLKAPRMGGPLAVLRSLEHATRSDHPSPGDGAQRAAGARVYLGGMFEVGVGRTQARQLAALYCPHAPNDLALNVRAPAGSPRRIDASPAQVSFGAQGFGTD
jgi:L-alanine-DL-glutamate epimerase-like enolase superfamily enzyme